MTPFYVAITGDFLKPDGTWIASDLGLSVLDTTPGVNYQFLPRGGPELTSDQVVDLDAVLVLSPRVTAPTVDRADRLLLVARAGVGYDSVDVAACTKAGVIVTITPDGVRRPMALAAITLLLALTHRLLIKDRLTRDGCWDKRVNHFGTGLVERTLGVVGYGNIGREVARLGAGLYMRPIVADPLIRPHATELEGVRLVDLPTLLSEADFVVICCPLSTQTYHLIDASALAQMKSTAFLINVARGSIVDQTSLTRALSSGRIAGAGLDVFETEPVSADDPLLRLDNVVVAPHSLGWTDDAFRDNGRSACQSIVDVAAGRVPRHVLNPDVLHHPKVKARLTPTVDEGAR